MPKGLCRRPRETNAGALFTISERTAWRLWHNQWEDTPVELTHFDEAGRAHMVDVGAKTETAREAVATGVVWMRPATLALIRAGGMAKGDVLAVAQVAGVMAAKQTPQIIPMCHTLLLTGVDIAFELDGGDTTASAVGDPQGETNEATHGAIEGAASQRARIAIRATVRTVGRTGAEMEALTAVSAAALTIYDMCKAVDRAMEIDAIHLLRKSGGKSGDYRASHEAGVPAAG